MAIVCFSSLFWGTLLLIGGASLLVQAFFGITIPIFKTFIALVLFYVGFTLLFQNGRSCKRTEYRHTKSQHPSCFVYTANGFFSEDILFGQKCIDFTQINRNQGPFHHKFTVACASVVLKIDRSIPTRIRVKTILGSARFPHQQITCGSYEYRTSTQEPALDIIATVSLGSLQIIEQ